MARISQKDAKKLGQNYLEAKSPAMDGIVGKEDSNAIWFEIQDLENYIAYAKQEAENQGQIINGMRIYLGSYSKDEDNRELAGMTTVFISATLEGVNAEANSEDLNADAFNFGGIGWPPKRVY